MAGHRLALWDATSARALGCRLIPPYLQLEPLRSGGPGLSILYLPSHFLACEGAGGPNNIFIGIIVSEELMG